MILQSLVNYYEILANDEESNIPKLGYCKAKISYAVNISVDGELLNIIPLKIGAPRGKKIVEVSQSMEVPDLGGKTSGVKSNFLWGNSNYVFGIDNKGKLKRSKECFEAFKQLHTKFLQDIDNAMAKAVTNFVSNWDSDKAMEHPALKEYLDEILSGGNFVIKVNSGEFVHQNKEIRQAWEKHISNSDNINVMQCLVTGKDSSIARLHPNISGVRGALSVGGSMVSFNKPAYESYGRDDQQGLNAPVSEYATFAYTTVLNYLLADISHKIYLGDATIVFWAESPKKIYQDFMSLYINGGTVNNDENIVNDEVAASEVKSIFEKIAQGKPIDELSDVFDEKTNFHILAISPNAARLAVRFFISNSFGELVNKIAMHYRDLRIEKQYPTDPDVFSIWRLLNETVSPKSNDKAANPLMAGATLKAIITGYPYPASLYNSIMLRIKAEKDINYYKVSIIKGYLLRKCKSTNKYKEVLVMALNENSDNRAYIFGRLFAVLEKAQLDANPGINSTIKDRYFTSACATPASVFPILLRLSQHHISKAEYGYASDKKIANILEKLDIDNNPFPSNLLLDDQGVFILGYYHQRNALYQKNNNKSEEK
ncbi:MAG: csd1 family CRISPR-associated protein [Clostridiales bacterium]|jgi:CRISPR-associated protein Csd1|nr:csd1 family CRISPR-associated protein [Clostridiales bacterium]